ncbi:uncharacterized protein LOC135958552 [Calliphora vicina]|uniref:uncharacterized protein LOC135958552 n=1 Tax=Calliphora vicina TaxID=7373 RepID=UPI00325AD6C9
MSQFLVDRYEAVERLNSIKTTKDCFTLSDTPKSDIQTYISQENLNLSCKLCKENHSLRICPKFRAFTVQQRVDYVFKNKFCNNCLASSHLKANCRSKYTCLQCKKPHHTLLHMKPKIQHATQSAERSQYKDSAISHNNQNQNSSTNTQISRINPQDEIPSTSRQFQANCSTCSENILLRTALMQIEHRGELFTIRALIDPGSQRTFLTERIRNRIQLPYEKSHFKIYGIGGQRQTANKECELVLYAKRYDLRIPIKAIVLPKVTEGLPAHNFEIPDSTVLKELDLADTTFNKSSQIDLILGNDYEHSINIEGIKKNVCGQTSAYNTVFGWVLSGPIKTQTIQTFTTAVTPCETADLNNTLKRFWEQEEIPTSHPKAIEHDICEKFYTQTTTRQENGRYVVRLPFKSEFPDKVSLGSSRYIALAQYSSLEKTLAKDPELQAQYKSVLNDYITLDHMEETSSSEIVSKDKYYSFYLPHHAVVRPEHKTTKLRIVFNASRKSKSKISLNDVLHTGPTLQNDLITIILNWRKYQYVFSGDIEKMYRQILVHPSDRSFQRILFQNESDDPIKDYQLKTVTFGINCAPYLAIRTLLQLASDSELEYPRAASVLRTETYVDDILSGGYTIEEALSAQTELIKTLNSARFPLRKITANDPRLLSHIPKEDLYDSDFLRFHDASSTKTLDIKWNALSDSFSYNFDPFEQATKISKRQILSSVAKLFDPAGWLAPIVIRAKTLIQQLWLECLEWDEDVSQESLQKWNELVQDLSQVTIISISRWIQYNPSDKIQLHGFSDASKIAYCATIYLRCQTRSQTTFINLLVAKSKVAPIQTVSLPRLELSGAVLLANLVNYVTSSFKINTEEIHLWTDSSITLGWLSKPPSTWETYVANRIAQIHRLVSDAKWHHVPSHDNPADLGTRGCKPQDLAHNSLWWHGPSWLTKPSTEWPKRNPLKTLDILKNETQSLHTEVQDSEILSRF